METYDILKFNIKTLQNKRDALNEILQMNNKQVNDLYHRIETTKFNVCQGYILARELRTVLQDRRKTKFEISEVDSTICNLEKAIQNLKEVQERNKQKLIDYTKEAEEKTKNIVGF